MALKLRLKPCERVVINGCVVQNENRRYTLTVSNFAQIIRGSDILQEEDAVTPVRRAYFLIQNMLLDPTAAATGGGAVADAMAQLYTAFTRPDIQDRIARAMGHVGERDYYKALAALRPVMDYEGTLLAATGAAAAVPAIRLDQQAADQYATGQHAFDQHAGG
ncbi:flagellar protein [Azospirillum thiophilum]|uniref:Flagellar protein n=1 Tax=Azospirillum thiophilum TaxID=528244 RepID=A0AAC8W4M4_9PROT|nr:flagellar biosynthesis repressor FlbT [Azospirillum thiophilum]ALG74937.1 flagellar protein [Azospirillum thiophilum]KJR62324.1 flagellar protein [Azospirillum thiophilum]